MKGAPPDLRPLVALVRGAAASCTLRGRYDPLPGGNAALRGQCENAAALFHLLAGGTAAGWRMMRIGPEAWPLGPHYFVRHVSGVVVDPTADQFPPGERVPYELARGQSAGGFRRVPAGTRVGSVGLAGQTATPEALRAALRLPAAPAAAAASLARQWAGLHAPAGRRKNNSGMPRRGAVEPLCASGWLPPAHRWLAVGTRGGTEPTIYYGQPELGWGFYIAELRDGFYAYVEVDADEREGIEFPTRGTDIGDGDRRFLVAHHVPTVEAARDALHAWYARVRRTK